MQILAKPSNDVVSFEEFSAGLKVCTGCAIVPYAS